MTHMLLLGEVCCSVLQCVAVCCSVLQCMAQLVARIREGTVLLLGEVRGSVLQGVAHFVALVTEGTMPHIILLGEVCCS